MAIPSTAEPSRRQIVAERLSEAGERLAAHGIVSGRKDCRVSVRIDGAVLEAARNITGLHTDTELINAALLLLADADDFGAWLNSQSGSLDPEFALNR